MKYLIFALVAILLLNVIICYCALCVAAEEDRRLEELFRDDEEIDQNG